MENGRACDIVLPQFFQKSTSLVVHLNDSIHIPEDPNQDDIHSVICGTGVEHFCRICGSESDGMKSLVCIFGDRGNQIGLHKKIVIHLHLQVEKDDHLPQQVCSTCIYQLNSFHQLYEMSHAANTKLRQMFHLPLIPSSESICLSVPVDIIPGLESMHHNQVREDPAPENTVFIKSQELECSDSITGDCESEKTGNDKAEQEGDHVKADNKDDSTSSLLCHICGKHFKHPSNLQSHKRTHLADSLKKKHHCSLCPKAFRSNFHLSEHMNIHNGVTPYSCSQCNKAFHKRAQLRQHAQTHIHDSKKAVCEVCGLRFSRRSNLQAHAKTHVRDRTFDCRLCHQQFPTFSAMLSHRKQHSQDDIRNRLSLDLVKNKESIFTCGVCGKLLTNKDSLVSHLEQHQSGKTGKYECTDCGKVLRSRRSLVYHQRSQHSGERPFHCSICSEGFMMRKLLQAHERRHTGEKPFKCETCWKGFRSRNNLSQHMLKHNGEKNFECSVCGKRFFRKGALTVHNRKHTGEKPFICDLCGRPFKQKNDMLKHQKTHLEPNSRTHTCELCMAVFTSKKELVKHKDTVHKESVSIVPLIITNNMFETHIITEDGQKIVFTTVEALDGNNLGTPSTSI